MKFDLRKIVYSTVFLVIVLDLITRACNFYKIDGFLRYGGVSKLIIEILLIGLIFKKGVKDKKIVYYILILSSSFLIGQLTLNQGSLNGIYKDVYILSKYLYLFILVLCLKTLDKREEILKFLYETLLVLGFVNAFAMLIGLIFEIEFLRSYYYSERFGFCGIMARRAETSYIYIFLIAGTYHEFLQNNNLKNFLIFLFFVAVSFIIGTKASWLFVALLLMFHMLFQVRAKMFFRIFTAMILIFIVMFYDTLKSIIIDFLPFGEKIYSDHGFITVLTSTRDLLLIETLSFIREQWQVLNYIFGGIDYYKHQVEFEFFNIFFFFGIVGLIVYFLFIKQNFFKKRDSLTKVMLFFTIILTVALAGNLFTSIICSTYLLVVMNKISNKIIID